VTAPDFTLLREWGPRLVLLAALIWLGFFS
jgi:hypothetical protein